MGEFCGAGLGQEFVAGPAAERGEVAVQNLTARQRLWSRAGGRVRERVKYVGQQSRQRLPIGQRATQDGAVIATAAQRDGGAVRMFKQALLGPAQGLLMVEQPTALAIATQGRAMADARRLAQAPCPRLTGSSG